MRFSIFILIFLFSQFAFAQNPKMDIQTDVVFLSSDYLQGRSPGTEGEKIAARYIASRMKELGLAPKGNNGTYLQVFPFEIKPNPHDMVKKKARKGEGRNVIGYLDNNAKNTIIIGAHFDHLGWGDSGSRNTGEPAIHNGADDNASGVAALLYIANFLDQKDYKMNNYLFIAFSGEEMGLFGSKYFTENPTINLDKVNYMLNMDMVGRLNEEKVLAISGTGTSPAWEKTVTDNMELNITVKTSPSGIGPTDHTSFYLKNLPVLHFFTGQHTDYHTPTDDAALINFEGIELTAEYIKNIISATNKNGKIEFTKTKTKKSEKAASFKVTLGIMPDYVFTGVGTKIDGVIEGRPAANSGIIDGDIIVKMGDLIINDIYDYMKGLAQYQPGDKSKVTVERDGKEQTFEVQF